MRLIITTILLLFMSGIFFKSFSQIQLGVKAGLGYSDIVVVNTPNDNDITFTDEFYHIKSSYSVGGYGILPFTERWQLSTSLLYISKGCRIENLTETTSEFNLHYLSIPVLLQYQLVPDWYLEVGPEVAYLLSSSYEPVFNTPKIDLGVNAGIHYALSEKLGLEMRYYFGLSNILPDIQITDVNGNLIDHTIKFQNRVLQLSATYRLI